MTTEFETLIEVLEISVRRNGPDTPLTLGHLLNILKLAERRLEKEERNEEIQYDYRYGTNN